jgi:[acyl-carrier-protein] S-malonyltransferase
VHSFDAGIYDDADSIRDGLYRQLFNPVRWSAIVAAIVSAKATHLVECGPGKVLTGLARRAPGGRHLNLQAIESPETLAAALNAVEGSKAS